MLEGLVGPGAGKKAVLFQRDRGGSLGNARSVQPLGNRALLPGSGTPVKSWWKPRPAGLSSPPRRNVRESEAFLGKSDVGVPPDPCLVTQMRNTGRSGGDLVVGRGEPAGPAELPVAAGGERPGLSSPGSSGAVASQPRAGSRSRAHEAWLNLGGRSPVTGRGPCRVSSPAPPSSAGGLADAAPED